MIAIPVPVAPLNHALGCLNLPTRFRRVITGTRSPAIPLRVQVTASTLATTTISSKEHESALSITVFHRDRGNSEGAREKVPAPALSNGP